MRRIACTLFALALLAAFPTAAGAVPTITGEFSFGPLAEPKFIAQGPDGNMWVTLGGGTTDDFAKVAPDGTVTQYDSPNVSSPAGITAGPDGQMWATGPTKVFRFLPSNPVGAVDTVINAMNSGEGIISGPDGNLWAASGEDIFRIPPAAPATAEPPIASVTGMAARGMAASTDGRIWVADQAAGQIISVTTAGATTAHPVSNGGVMDIAAGPNGQVAFTSPLATPQLSGLFAFGGSVTPVPMPLADPFGIDFGPDGAYWTARFASKDIARISTTGQVTTLGGFSPGSGPRRIAAGPGNTLWVVLEGTNKVARISGVDPAPTGTPDTVAPAVSKLSLTNAKFAVGAKSTALIAKKKKPAPKGTTLSFTSSEAGSAAIRVEKILPGKRSGKKCVAPRKSLRKKKNCNRFKLSGTLQRIALAGSNKVAFSGRLGKKKLAPGNYRFVITVTDVAGNGSSPKSKPFKIVR